MLGDVHGVGHRLGDAARILEHRLRVGQKLSVCIRPSRGRRGGRSGGAGRGRAADASGGQARPGGVLAIVVPADAERPTGVGPGADVCAARRGGLGGARLGWAGLRPAARGRPSGASATGDGSGQGVVGVSSAANRHATVSLIHAAAPALRTGRSDLIHGDDDAGRRGDGRAVVTGVLHLLEDLHAAQAALPARIRGSGDAMTHERIHAREGVVGILLFATHGGAVAVLDAALKRDRGLLGSGNCAGQQEHRQRSPREARAFACCFCCANYFPC